MIQGLVWAFCLSFCALLFWPWGALIAVVPLLALLSQGVVRMLVFTIAFSLAALVWMPLGVVVGFTLMTLFLTRFAASDDKEMFDDSDQVMSMPDLDDQVMPMPDLDDQVMSVPDLNEENHEESDKPKLW